MHPSLLGNTILLIEINGEYCQVCNCEMAKGVAHLVRIGPTSRGNGQVPRDYITITPSRGRQPDPTTMHASNACGGSMVA